MYIELAILALFVFCYTLVSGRLERAPASGPIVFVAAGFLMGPMVLAWFDGDVSRTELRVLADLTLALILFIDAANADHPDITAVIERTDLQLKWTLEIDVRRRHLIDDGLEQRPHVALPRFAVQARIAAQRGGGSLAAWRGCPRWRPARARDDYGVTAYALLCAPSAGWWAIQDLNL